MKRILLSILFITAIKPGFTQNLFSRYDAYIASTFDLLNNKVFADLQLEDTSGQIVHTSSLLGKTIYVDFWFTTCPPCIKQIPASKKLHDYFKQDTNIVFLNICIENVENKAGWKQMIKEKEMPGIHLFYARNKPQKINLLREYKITFPTYLLVNSEMKIIGYNAPRPSEQEFVYWVIVKAKENFLLSESFKQARNNSPEYQKFHKK